jgi:hypothetical protein
LVKQIGEISRINSTLSNKLSFTLALAFKGKITLSYARWLTPKIPCGFWAKPGNFGHNYSKKKFRNLNVKPKGINHSIMKLLYKIG